MSEGYIPNVRVESFLVEHEIREFILRLPDRPEPGYLWRLKLAFPKTDDCPERIEWGPWMFVSNRAADDLVRTWKETQATFGHPEHGTPDGERLQ